MEPSCIESFVSHIKKYEDVSLLFLIGIFSLKIDQIKNARTFLMVVAIWQKNGQIFKNFNPICELLENPNLLSGSINKIGEPTNTFILRKAFLESGGFDPQFSQLLDLDLWFRLMTLGNVVYIDEKHSKFRIHNSQQSVINSKENRIHSDFLKLYSKILISKSFSSLSEDFRFRVLEVAKPAISANILKGEVNQLSDRIKFMEASYFWKLRKKLIKTM